MNATRATGDDRPKQQRFRAPVRRELILEAALRVFAEQGSSAPVGQVAEAAGITRPVLYYYFETKQELFLATLERQASVLLERLAPLVNLDATERERAHALLSAAVAFADEEPLGWDILFRPGEDDEPDVRAAREAVFAAAKASFLDLVRPAVQRDDLDPAGVLTNVTVEGGLGAVVAIIQWWRTSPDVDRSQLIDAMFSFLWPGIASVVLGGETRDH